MNVRYNYSMSEMETGCVRVCVCEKQGKLGTVSASGRCFMTCTVRHDETALSLFFFSLSGVFRFLVSSRISFAASSFFIYPCSSHYVGSLRLNPSSPSDDINPNYFFRCHMLPEEEEPFLSESSYLTSYSFSPLFIFLLSPL